MGVAVHTIAYNFLLCIILLFYETHELIVPQPKMMMMLTVGRKLIGPCSQPGDFPRISPRIVIPVVLKRPIIFCNNTNMEYRIRVLDSTLCFLLYVTLQHAICKICDMVN